MNILAWWHQKWLGLHIHWHGFMNGVLLVKRISENRLTNQFAIYAYNLNQIHKYIHTSTFCAMHSQQQFGSLDVDSNSNNNKSSRLCCVCVWACVRVSVCPYGHRIPERLNQICWGWLLYAQQCTNDIIPSLLLSLTLSLSLARFALATNTHPRHIGHTAHTTIQQNSNTQKWHRDKEKSSEAAYTNRNRLEFKRIKRREKRYLLRITGINNKMGESDFLYMLAAFLICVLFLTFVSCLESPHECM